MFQFLLQSHFLTCEVTLQCHKKFHINDLRIVPYLKFSNKERTIIQTASVLVNFSHMYGLCGGKLQERLSVAGTQQHQFAIRFPVTTKFNLRHQITEVRRVQTAPRKQSVRQSCYGFAIQLRSLGRVGQYHRQMRFPVAPFLIGNALQSKFRLFRDLKIPQV